MSPRRTIRPPASHQRRQKSFADQTSTRRQLCADPVPIRCQSGVSPANPISIQRQSAVNQMPIQSNTVPIDCQSNVNPIPHQSNDTSPIRQANVDPSPIRISNLNPGPIHHQSTNPMSIHHQYANPMSIRHQSMSTREQYRSR